MLRVFKSTPQKSFGALAEQHVGAYLKKQGYTVLCYNYTIRAGEIDIIAQHKETIIFVEVKARTNNYFNSSEVVTASKQKKIIRTARYYCQVHSLYNKIYRFDVALVHTSQQEFDVTYIPNAFTGPT